MPPFSPARWQTRLMPWAVACVAALFLVGHLGQLPRSLEDFDSVNFAMGVRSFDVTQHQPHPPGYPAFIGLARLSTGVLRLLGAARPEVTGLAIWSLLAGTLAVFPLFNLFRGLRQTAGSAFAASVVTVTAPLFWFTACRPLSDMTGLAAALVVQALAVTVWHRQRDATFTDDAVRRWIVLTAFGAGAIVGLRSQGLFLTLPVVAWVLFDPRIPSRRRAVVSAAAALAVGVAVWALPMVIATGGLIRYWQAASAQAGDDFRGVVMLWTHHSWREIAIALRDTGLRPWGQPSLGVAMIVAAGIGAVAMGLRSRTALKLLAVLYVPYAVFHLLFHETATVRYALPLVPPVTLLAVIGLSTVARVVSWQPVRALVMAAGIAIVTAMSLQTAIPALRAYASAPSPSFRALSDIAASASDDPENAGVLVSHVGIRRSVEWTGIAGVMDVLTPEPSYEWLSAVRYWLAGGRAPVWFLARPVRTDLALVDPRHVNLVRRYEWAFDTATFLGGARPSNVDWYTIERPQWFLDKGWALTPEAAGVSAAHGDGPSTSGSVAYLARRSDETTLMVGGRQLGASRSTAQIHVKIDGRPILDWVQAPGFFLKMHTLPAGTLRGDGDYARLTITSSSVDGEAPISLEQFDMASSSDLVWGYGDGWLEPEFDKATKRLWRWSTGESKLRLRPTSRPITVRVIGDSPTQPTGLAPTLTIKAGELILDRFRPSGNFEREFTVADEILRAAGGTLTMASDATFRPDETQRNGDKRTLAVRVFKVMAN